MAELVRFAKASWELGRLERLLPSPLRHRGGEGCLEDGRTDGDGADSVPGQVTSHGQSHTSYARFTRRVRKLPCLAFESGL